MLSGRPVTYSEEGELYGLLRWAGCAGASAGLFVGDLGDRAVAKAKYSADGFLSSAWPGRKVCLIEARSAGGPSTSACGT